MKGLFREDTPYAPNSPYSASKAGSDHLVRAWHHTYGLPVVATNCSNNYGPYHFPEKLIPLIILNALEGKKLPVYGAGENIRDWLFVEDHAEALLTVVEKGRVGESYNIGGINERRNIDVVNAICDLVDELAPNKDIGPRRELITYVVGSPRPRSALRHRLRENRPRTRLEAARDLRDRLAQDGAMVSRQSRMVGRHPLGPLSRRAPRRAGELSGRFRPRFPTENCP